MRLLRMLGIGLAMLAAVGFGLCGAYGVIGGVVSAFTPGERPLAAMFVLCGLVGLVLAASIVMNVLEKKRPNDQPPEQ